MKNKKYNFLALVAGTGLAMLAADFLILLFFGNTFSQLRFRFGIPAFVFFIIYCVILGRGAQYFDYNYFTKLKGEEYLLWLKKIGAVPIKRIALNVITHAVFLGIVFLSGNYLGIDPSIKSSLFLAALSFGMLVGTFIYVAGDGLVSGTLLAHNFTVYPPNYHERRQEAKAWIIPLAAILVTLGFTCSVTLLGIHRSGNSLSSILIPLIVFFLGTAALAFTLKRNTGALYSSVIAQLENLSSEQKDLTRRISICSVDELGSIAGMVNTFSEHLGGGISDIKDGQKNLSAVGNRLEGNASTMADSIAKISTAVEQVLVKTKGQMESANTSSREVRQISEQIKSLEETIFTQTSSITEASAAVEEMVGNISSIGSVTEKMAAQFKTVGEASEAGMRIQKESGDRIRMIVEQSQTLQEANKIISLIAVNTNLFSMNAAIEAAHAGESGKGFAVVADEIRKLAENSAAESRKIRSELKQITATIDRIVKDATVSENAFAEVSRRIDETGKLVVEVDNAIHEQKTGASEVMESLRVMKDLTMKVKDGSQEMNRGSEAMVKEINTLQNSAAEIETRMEEISGGIGTINKGAKEVSTLAADTHDSIDKISGIANGFKV
ncbi:methyl-accepting chemotaxis protein [Treponema sp. R80B11-R83G3]